MQEEINLAAKCVQEGRIVRNLKIGEAYTSGIPGQIILGII